MESEWHPSVPLHVQNNIDFIIPAGFKKSPNFFAHFVTTKLVEKPVSCQMEQKMSLTQWRLDSAVQNDAANLRNAQMNSCSFASGTDRKSLKFACVNAFNKLNQQFSELVFDLRRNSFQDFENSFEQIKSQMEQNLNGLNYDRPKLVVAFNSQAQPVRSADNQNFDVLAKLSDSGRIVLQFMDR